MLSHAYNYLGFIIRTLGETQGWDLWEGLTVPLFWLLSSNTYGTGEPRRILVPLCQHAHKYSTKLELSVAWDHCNLVTQPFQIFETTKLWIWQRVPGLSFPRSLHHFLIRSLCWPQPVTFGDVGRYVELTPVWIIGQCSYYMLSNSIRLLVFLIVLWKQH